MRIWNLTEPSALNDVVVDDFSTTKPARAKATFSTGLRSVKVLASMASMAVTLSFSNFVVNQGSVRLPNWAVAIARSAPDIKSPLDSMFVGRFDSEWTKIEESALINDIVENRLTKDMAGGSETIARFVHSNQQENIMLESPRLSMGVVQEIVRKRKSS